MPAIQKVVVLAAEARPSREPVADGSGYADLVIDNTNPLAPKVVKAPPKRAS